MSRIADENDKMSSRVCTKHTYTPVCHCPPCDVSTNHSAFHCQAFATNPSLMAIRLNRLAQLGVSLLISEFSLNTGWPATASGDPSLDLNERQQSLEVTRLVSQWFSHPAVNGVIFGTHIDCSCSCVCCVPQFMYVFRISLSYHMFWPACAMTMSVLTDAEWVVPMRLFTHLSIASTCRA